MLINTYTRFPPFLLYRTKKEILHLGFYWSYPAARSAYAKTAGLSDKTGRFSFWRQKFSFCLNACNPLQKTKFDNKHALCLSSRFLFCPAENFSLSDKCPGTLQDISRLLGTCTWHNKMICFGKVKKNICL